MESEQNPTEENNNNKRLILDKAYKGEKILGFFASKAKSAKSFASHFGKWQRKFLSINNFINR